MAIRLKKYLKQKLVYWAKVGSGGSGQPIFAAAKEMDCRWDDVTQEVMTMDRRIIVSNAQIMAASPFKAGGIIFQGTLNDWKSLSTYPAVPTKNQGGYEIFVTKGIPDLKGRPLLFEAIC